MLKLLKLLIVSSFFHLIMFNVSAQTKKINATRDTDFKIDVLNETPEWAENCKLICMGNYTDHVVNENTKYQLISIVGNAYQKPTRPVTNLIDFLLIFIM